MKNKLPATERVYLKALLHRAGFFPELINPIVDLYEQARTADNTTAEIAVGPGGCLLEISIDKPEQL